MTDPLCGCGRESSDRFRAGTVEALLLAAEREVRARAPGGLRFIPTRRRRPKTESRALRTHFQRSGLPDSDQRMISRGELLNVLGGVSQLAAADRWAEGLGQEYAAEPRRRSVASVVVPTLRAGWKDR